MCYIMTRSVQLHNETFHGMVFKDKWLVVLLVFVLFPHLSVIAKLQTSLLFKYTYILV